MGEGLYLGGIYIIKKCFGMFGIVASCTVTLYSKILLINNCVGNEQLKGTQSIVKLLCIYVGFSLSIYKYNYCSKLHCHLFMPVTFD